MNNVMMPEMGEGVIEGTVSRWLKSAGDTVAQYEPILEIETDKVTTEAMAEVGGVLLEILVPEGETVEVGTRNAMPVNFPCKAGITNPTARAAPVEEGTILSAAARASRRSGAARSSRRCELV